MKQGDMAGYEAIFNRYYNLFLAFVLKFVKDRHAAEDVVQEIFMKLWMHREHLDENRSLYNLLFTMAKHRIYDHFRLKHNLGILHRPLQEYDTVWGGEDVAGSNYDAEQLQQAIAQTVGTMPPQRQAVFTLSRQESLSRHEIAERLELSVRTVDKHLELALRTIRLHLKDFYWMLFLLFIR